MSYVHCDSVDSAGNPIPGILGGALSYDNRYFVYVAQSNRANGAIDVFARDLTSGTLRTLSVKSDGSPSDQAVPIFSGLIGNPSISGNGLVAFTTADQLLADDTDNSSDIYIRSLYDNSLRKVPDFAFGSHIYNPVFSSDGSKLVFSTSNNAVSSEQLYIYDLTTGTVSPVAEAGTDAATYSRYSRASFSSDNRYVLFDSSSSTLVAGDNNNQYDVFLFDTISKSTIIVSRSESFSNPRGSYDAAMSGNGLAVVFRSNDGQVYVKDLSSGQVSDVSTDKAGVAANGQSSSTPDISADGRYVVFESTATNLVTGDTNGVPDIFVKDLVTGDIGLISVAFDGTQSNGGSYAPKFSEDGQSVIFSSSATNLARGVSASSQFYEVDWYNAFVAAAYHNYVGGPNADELFASQVSDTMTGKGGDDALYGRGGDDVIFGDAGNDRLDGGAGIDRMYGSTGDDVFYVDRQDDLAFENAGEGADTVISTANFYLYANIENLTLAAGAGNIFGVGNELDNVITGNEGANTLLAGAGNDTVHGGAGVDIIYGEDGADQLFGDADNDVIVGGAGSDVIDGGTGGDLLYGEDGNDTLTGGTDFVFDQLVGGAGNDVLHGDSGQGDFDYLIGNTGDDTYYVDTYADLVFENPGEGTDTVYASTAAGSGYYLYANIENLVLTGQTFYGVGNELANTMTGSALDNWLLGGAGNDILNGKGGNDVLFGQDGADTFVFEKGTGGDTIADFVAGTDRIDLSAFGFASFAQLQAAMSESGGTTAIILGGGDFIVLQNVTNAQLHAGDFILSRSGGAQIELPGRTDPDDAPRGGLINQFDMPHLMVAAGDLQNYASHL